MGCWLSQVQDPKPLIVDVQQVIADETWTMFYYSHGWFKRLFLFRRNFIVDVPMNYYDFEERKQDVKVRRKTKDTNLDLDGKGKSLLAGKKMAYRDQTSPEIIGLETEFTNSTSTEQTYNFRFEKTRKATLHVTFQKGFSFGNRTNFSIGVPKIMGEGTAGTEFETHIEITKTTEETFEETLTTSTTSDITVAPHSHYTATVVMQERMVHADFTVWVRMVMPAKEARSYVKNKKGDVVFYYRIYDLSDFFPEPTHIKENGETRQDAVEFLVEGVVDGIQLSSHRIKLISRDVAKTKDEVYEIQEVP